MDATNFTPYNGINPPQDIKNQNLSYCDTNQSHEYLATEESECCKTLYTKCDYLREQNVHENILKLEQLFKDYDNFFNQEMEMQRELLNDMWTQSQKYLILTRSGVYFKPYPESVSHHTERNISCQFYTNLTNIKRSNCLLSESMQNILKTHSELNKLCQKLDMSVESPFIRGTYPYNSLNYIGNILNDLLCCFYDNLCKMTCCVQLLHPGDSISIENYMNLIEPNRKKFTMAKN